tara:strand:- start:67 stop:2331 length:2265 start_codon:yes stop_codon:yes gene_type:complete
MNDLYLIIVIALGVLAIGDLIVGVSNDAVNFLNSAVGSKAIPFKTIMVLASLGVAVGALFSSGLMEVARKGIFNPGEFYFDEIMLIFTAVMLTDILLLDFFNTLGMPTSTTVSIVFELLGAAVFMSMIKIGSTSGDFSELVNYINTSKAIQIVLGILLSVFAALTIGALVQWIARAFLTYEFEKKQKWISALFGGIALSAITYFILMKGIKGTPFANIKFDIIGGLKIKDFLEAEVFKVVVINFLLWFGISFSLIKFFKLNIYKIIIGTGTFALALAFAGNDLVNFIGVPIAAFQSYEAWVSSGALATEFNMAILSSKVPTPTLLLVLSGLVMVSTLWFSNKAKSVLKTSLDLSNQSNVKERFQANFLSKLLVKVFSSLNKFLIKILPNQINELIKIQFSGSNKAIKIANNIDAPSFDMLRACINLIVASILISIATSYKLPLSTTYVTFMVAMGTSLADRAWGSDSAVYRVAGVINVIGGWFLTALIAFLVSGIIVSLIFVGGLTAIAIILFIILIIIGKNYLKHKNEITNQADNLLMSESSSMQGVLEESALNIVKVFKRVGKIYGLTVSGLSANEIDVLKKCKKNIKKLSDEVEELRDNIFYFIKNLEEPSLSAGHFYISMLGYIQDMTEDLEYIVNKSFKHINNGHDKLKLSQIRDLNDIFESYDLILKGSMKGFYNASNSELENVWERKDEIMGLLNKKIDAQIERTRSIETSPRNTTLYFNILLKSKELVTNKLNLIKEHYETSARIS